MVFMPLNFLIIWLVGLLSIGLLGGGWPAVLARGTLAMFNFNQTQTLSTINVPVLIVVGTSDIATVPAASKRTNAELPYSELVTLKPAGHMGLMEQNQRFAEAVSAFSAACL